MHPLPITQSWAMCIFSISRLLLPTFVVPLDAVPRQKDTPFRDFSNGTLTRTLIMLGVIRLLLPQVLLPATTALGTIHPRGREMGILAGANVVMPNLSPRENRKKYLLYDNKLGTGEESGEGLELLKQQMSRIGYEVVTDRGDYKEKGMV